MAPNTSLPGGYIAVLSDDNPGESLTSALYNAVAFDVNPGEIPTPIGDNSLWSDCSLIDSSISAINNYLLCDCNFEDSFEISLTSERNISLSSDSSLDNSPVSVGNISEVRKHILDISPIAVFSNSYPDNSPISVGNTSVAIEFILDVSPITALSDYKLDPSPSCVGNTPVVRKYILDVSPITLRNTSALCVYNIGDSPTLVACSSVCDYNLGDRRSPEGCSHAHCDDKPRYSPAPAGYTSAISDYSLVDSPIYAGYTSVICDYTFGDNPVPAGHSSVLCDDNLGDKRTPVRYTPLLIDNSFGGRSRPARYTPVISDYTLVDSPIYGGYTSLICDYTFGDNPEPVGHSSVLCDENLGDIRTPVRYNTPVLTDNGIGGRSRPSRYISAISENTIMWEKSEELIQNEEDTQPKAQRKSHSRGHFPSSRKFSGLPRFFRRLFTHKKKISSSKHLHNQTVESFNPSQGQLNLSSKQSSNKSADQSNHSDQLLPEPLHLKKTVVSANDCHKKRVKASNDCHKQTIKPAKPVGGDRNMADSELKTGGDVQNMGTGSQNQDQLGQTGRVASWTVHFDKLLQDPLGINIFTKFLEKEFSDENIRFWQVCQQFRGLTEQQQQQALAKDIYNRHIAAKARDPVNIDFTARSHIEQFLDSPSSAMFDVAISQIRQLMKLDSYPRFLKSDLYKNMLVEEIVCNTRREMEQTRQMNKKKKQKAGKEHGGKRMRSLLSWIPFL